jgi:hypothetical protein
MKRDKYARKGPAPDFSPSHLQQSKHWISQWNACGASLKKIVWLSAESSRISDGAF